MKTYIVTHRDDVDGIMSGSLLRRLYGPVTELIFCSYPEQERVFRQLADLAQGAQIYIADICAKDYPGMNGGKSVLEQLAASAARLEWYDHHSGTRDIMTLFKGHGHTVIMGDKQKICSAGLINSRHLLADRYCELLARIAQAHDNLSSSNASNRFAKIGNSLQKIISYFNFKKDIKGLIELVDLIAHDASWLLAKDVLCPYLEGIIAAAEEQMGEAIERAYADIQKNLVAFKIKGKRFIVACGNTISSEKEVLIRLCQQYPEADGVMLYSLPPTNHALFYKGVKSDFNAEKFCEFMGGGGREGNGGFTPYIKYEQNNLGSLVYYITIKLGHFL